MKTQTRKTELQWWWKLYDNFSEHYIARIKQKKLHWKYGRKYNVNYNLKIKNETWFEKFQPDNNETIKKSVLFYKP